MISRFIGLNAGCMPISHGRGAWASAGCDANPSQSPKSAV